MEFEIHDDPQGYEDECDGYRDGGIVEDHIALKNQSSVSPSGYPASEREARSLVDPQQPE